MKKDQRDEQLRNQGSARQINTERRTFLASALVAVPSVPMLGACGSSAPESGEDGALLAGRDREFSVTPGERRQRRKWCARHVAEENERDIDGIMHTFARGAEVSVNGAIVTDREAIRAGHVAGGFSGAPGGLADLRVEPRIEYVTDDEIVYEGVLTGTHVGDMNGFAPTFREVAINYVAFYRFDRVGRLVSERLTFNHGVLAPPPA